MSERPGIYLWKAVIGWRFQVVLQIASTVVMWRPTHSMALRAAKQIVREEA